MYLLDTNAWIAYLNPGESLVRDRVRNNRPEDLFLCSVVRAELFYGAYKSSRSAENLRLLNVVFSMFPTIPFDDAAAEQFGQIRAHLENIGGLIGPNDLLIAAIARARGLTIVTHNVKEFSRIPGLVIEDWNEKI